MEREHNNILILMDMPLFPYRIYAYNELAERGYDLTVVSMSENEAEYGVPLKFRHIRLSYKSLLGFRYVRGLDVVDPDEYDVIIVAPNLRMLEYYKFYNKHYWHKLIGWGHHTGSVGKSQALFSGIQPKNNRPVPSPSPLRLRSFAALTGVFTFPANR